MGGKKKPNRTKGNARPSSSGRSAELLCSSGTSTSSFIGFSGLSYDALNYVPATSQTCEEVDIAVDSEFRLVMRKMTKKDDITKLKAMQEFTDLCQQKNEETLKGVLPFWPRLYNRLAMEHDRRVREATHRAHQELIKKVGRNLAPHLRSIMGVWLISQCEPYGPAATAAKFSFYEAFPETKQSEALMFCKDELFNYIRDNLFNQTQKTTEGSSTHTHEEMENKFHRILKCSLDGLSLFILTVSCKEYQKIENNIDEILQEPKFWKFAKHKEPMVQLSWYNLMISLCDKMPLRVIPHASKVCPLTLGQLAGSDSLVMPVIWESALYVLNIIEDCWKHVNIRKAVLPQLWSVLENGGHGNAVILFPKLLPLLSKIPCDIVGDKLTFHRLFFQNMKASLHLEKVQSSLIECNAIVQAFMECIQYVLSKSCQDEHDETLQQHIVLYQLLPVLETSITEEKCHLSRSCLYPKLKELLDYFRDQTSMNSCNGKAFERILELFWDNFFIMCNSVMDGDALVCDRRLSRLSKFFCCLHYAGNMKYKQKRKVGFSDNVATFKSSVENIKVPTFNKTTSVAADYHIVGPTQELCSKAMIKFETTKSLSYLKLLCEVMGTVASKELFSVLLKSSMNLSVCPDDAPVEYFYQALCPWVLDIDSVSENKRTYAMCLVNIAISICSAVSQEMAKKILDDFTKSKNSILLECLIENAAVVPKGNVLRLWLHGPHVGKMIVSHAEELCLVTLGKISSDTDYIDSVWNILHLCLTSSECSEPIIGTEYMSEILEIFHRCLMNTITNTGTGKRQVIEFVCDLSSRLFSGFKGCWQLKAAEDLLLSLFLLDCDATDPSADTVSEKLAQSWQLGVKHLLAEKDDLLHPDGFFFKAARKIHEQVVGQLYSVKSEERLATTTLKLLSIINEALEKDCNEALNSQISSQLEIIFPSDEHWENLQNTLKTQYLTSAILDQKLILTDSPTVPCQEASSLAPHCLVSLFVSEVFIAILNISQNEDDNHFIIGERSQEVILKQIHNIIVASTYCTYAGYGYKTTKTCTEGKEKMLLYEKLMHNVPLLLSALNENSYMILMNNLSNMSLHKGNIWPLCMASVIPFETGNASTKEHLTHLSNKINYEEIYHLQTLRAIIPYLSTKCVMEIVTKATNILICTEDVFSSQGATYLLSILVSCVEVKDISSEDDIQEHIITTLEYLLGIKSLNDNKFLENCTLSPQQDVHLYFIANTMSLLEKIVQKIPTVLEPKHWDFLLCTLVGWLQSCDASKSLYQNCLPILRFFVQAFGLLAAVVDFIDSGEKEAEPETFPPNLVTEWHELFAHDIYKISLPLYVNVAETNTDNNYLNIGEEVLLQNMAKSLQYIPATHIEYKLPSQREASTSKIFYLLNHLVPLLICGTRSVQLASHFLLMTIMPQLAKEMSEKEKIEEDQRHPPAPFIKHLQQTGPVVETMLSDFRIGDCCVLEPYTDAYTYGRAYLFAWIELLEFFYCASSEERSEYASFLCDKGLIDTMLNSLFCLMPHNPSLSCERGMKSVQQSKKHSSETMFTHQPSLAINDIDTSFELQHVACQLYLSALQKLPALVRQWWTNQEKRTAEIVNKFTSNYVSSCICSKEIQSVHEDDKKFTNMLVKPRPSAREVVATYTIDEVTIELMIQLPSNHPLGPVVVESGRRVGVAQTQWRNWMLQLTTFLTHQNGSILEGLALWKRNVDKRFEGVEECMICFYVVHGSTCQLPRLTCRTCKKKFHSACLYKWFSTSNNSSCPLCRNLF